jgi:hypothetical protein
VTNRQVPAQAVDDDTGFADPPRLRRLGTLAELTLAGGLGSGDAVGGFDGESGETSQLG